ncbi:MAG: phytanoyl-CoA dioxygenase family protein [Chloroflexota bacterium]|nr:phytanoyl-CoA dioxygenase family protein [Chloroflexota bacterium]
MRRATLLDHFHECGFVVIEGLLDPILDLQPLIDDYSALLDDLARRWYAERLLPCTHDHLPFEQRFLEVIGEYRRPYTQYFDISLPLGRTTAQTPIHLSKAVFDLLRNVRLLDAVETIIGPEILSNPIQHVRIKLPERLLSNDQQEGLATKTGWHQDQGVALPEADASEILTVWVAVTDATEENGCLCVVPGSHRAGLITHCRDKQIPDALVGEGSVSLPMERGSVLLMHRRTQHASLPNRSDGIRWSFDLRYQPIGQPTGRPMFPGFIARSRRDPTRVLDDDRTWANLWYEARCRLSQGETPEFSRWTGADPVCA